MCFGCVCGVTWSAPSLLGQDAVEMKLKKLSDDSRVRAEAIEVKTVIGGRTRKATIHSEPIMKYTDVPRQIEMATLWVWKDEGQLVALGKVEVYQLKDGQKWLYCFASASKGLVEGKWPDGRRFEARKAGVEWAPIKGPAPQEAAGRLKQMKDLFRRFTATVRDDVLKTSDELRPLARPIHEYSSPRHGILQGVLCGFTNNGTNPDVIVALELVKEADKDAPSWRYAVIGMTAIGISVKLDKAEAFNRPYAQYPKDFETWTYFWEGSPRK
jgi:hypothetical protein